MGMDARAASTSLTGALFPRWALEGGREATLQRLAHAAECQRLRADIATMFTKWSTPEGVVIARFVPDPGLEGKNMGQIAETLHCGPAEATLRLYERGEASVIHRPCHAGSGWRDHCPRSLG
jgi:N-acyl-D-amino-acid deacylase